MVATVNRLLSSDELQVFYREVLISKIEALEAARKGVEEGHPEASDAIRRIARSLRSSGGAYGFPEISETAGRVEEADNPELLPSLDHLLETLEGVASRLGAGKIGILVIEDDPEVILLLRYCLEADNRDLHVVSTAAEAEKLLEDEDIALIILDLVLPDMDGRNLLVRLRERYPTLTLPVIVLSARGGTETKVECFALGADVYLEKPVEPDLLSAIVTSKIQQASQIARESRQDPLTGLANRTAFREAFEREQSLANRVQYPLSLAILDLDKFKSVNDTYGHCAGDEVLRRVAWILTRQLRKSDLVGRWGGEEFIVLFADTSAEGAIQALEKVLMQLQREEFHENGQTFSVAFSAGVAAVEQDQSLEEAIVNADQRLYLAKSAGGNRIAE